ncbi:MAG: glycosyltransferase [candidate division WOR-3 bacterium]|nr:MAG: glycosyltransferase [candidate division WOR-3 bacterium]
MKILFATYIYLYPPESGYKKSLYPIVEHIAKKHDTTVLSFYEEGDVQHLDSIHRKTAAREINVARARMSNWRKFTYPIRYLTSILFSIPILEDNPVMTKVVKQLLHKEDFDIIQIQHLMMAQYFLNCRAPVLHAVQDVLSARYKRQIHHDITFMDRLRSLLYYFTIFIFEKRTVKHLTHCVMLSEPEKRRLLSVVPRYKDTSIIRYGVDIKSRVDFNTGKPKDILFIGYIAYRPNFDAVKYFIKDIFPSVKTHMKNAKLTIVGKGYEDELKQIAMNKDIDVIGPVSDISPYLSSHKVFVSPIRYGGGVRVKILEAMAHGTAVVSTSLGADGISVTHRKDIILADDPKSFAQWVVELLQNHELRQEIAKNAYEFARRFHDVRAYVRQYEGLYKQLLKHK